MQVKELFDYVDGKHTHIQLEVDSRGVLRVNIDGLCRVRVAAGCYVECIWPKGSMTLAQPQFSPSGADCWFTPDREVFAELEPK